MRRAIIAGNWKMHGTRAENLDLLGQIVAGLNAPRQAQVLVFPPFVYLSECVGSAAGAGIQVGAQDVSAESKGAFTGDVSATMLADIGCSHVLCGHSERRAVHGESDALVAAKFAAVQAAKLTPVLCVGETLAQREGGETKVVVARQLEAVLTRSGVESLSSATIAYEPVWAIGTGRTASPEQAQDVHAFIRGLIAARNANIAAAVRILYGGSVKASNSAQLFAMPDVDGGLVGGASLNAQEFLGIVAAGNSRG